MNILLIDDHILFAKSLEIVLEDNKVINKFQSLTVLDNINEHIKTINPDIILLDINLNNICEEDGITFGKRLLKVNKNMKIVFLTGYNLPVYRYEAKKMGASGFVDKNIEPDKLIEILININHGYTYFPNTEFIEELTSAEKRILQLLVNGIKRKEIARELYLSERTVSNHLQHIFSKLNVSSAVEAVTKAINLGYIFPDKIIE